MKICVQGLWHLGSVTAACMASVGHDVIGFDENGAVIERLTQGKAPLFEPKLNALIRQGLDNGKLYFTTNINLVRDVDILWVAYDTPVNDSDEADINTIVDHIQNILPYLSSHTLILISSQLPVGSVKKLERFVYDHLPNQSLHFAYSPENLRLGKALDIFLNPDRIVIGVRDILAKNLLEKMFSPITHKIEWMSIESAEMTKHAINSFLAMSITFANEIASICEMVGADAKEVERGLKSEERIGKKAYLSPGGPYAGGTLARDIAFLNMVSQSNTLVTPVLSAVRLSNEEHKKWIRRKLNETFSNLHGITIAIWGLTYKSDTDTLRRSFMVEIGDWLIQQGALLQIYEPLVSQFPAHWLKNRVTYCENAKDAISAAHVLIIGAQHPQFIQNATEIASTHHANFVVIDPYRHIHSAMNSSSLQYIAVGCSPSYKDYLCKEF